MSNLLQTKPLFYYSSIIEITDYQYFLSEKLISFFYFFE